MKPEPTGENLLPQVLIEIEAGPSTPVTGTDGDVVRKVSLSKVGGKVVDATGDLFRASVTGAIHVAANAFREAVTTLEHPPSTAEFSFGLKFSGELGNVIITKFAGESTCSVKLTWSK